MTSDAIVIGAGIVGAAVADALAADGMRVLVIEQGAPGGGTTSTGMGHIVALDDSHAQLALTSYSRMLFEQIARELPAACELERRGTLWIAADDAQLAEAHNKAVTYMAAGVDAAVIDAIALAEAEPQLRKGLAGAVHVPGDLVLYPRAVCAFLLERAGTRGARVVHAQAERIETGAVITAGDRHEAPVIVNAAGVHAPRLTPELRIVPRKGHLVMTAPRPSFCHHQIVELGYMQSAHVMTGDSVAFNIQPRRSGAMLIGSSRELAGFDTAINGGMVERMLQRATEFMPGLQSLDMVRTWAGLRPATPDKLPLIGPWEPVPGLWIAAGHEGLGATASLGTARIIADLIHGRTPDIDVRAFSPARMMSAATQ